MCLHRLCRIPSHTAAMHSFWNRCHIARLSSILSNSCWAHIHRLRCSHIISALVSRDAEEIYQMFQHKNINSIGYQYSDILKKYTYIQKNGSIGLFLYSALSSPFDRFTLIYTAEWTAAAWRERKWTQTRSTGSLGLYRWATVTQMYQLYTWY